MAEKGQEKVTWMKLKTAALSSEKNLIKVKKALCNLSQVRDQKFDEETNTVTIKVVCCSPEKVMDKLCSKGRGAIKLIKTIDPPKPAAQTPNEPEQPKEPEKPEEAEKPTEPEKNNLAPAQTGPSSQSVTVTHQSHSAPMNGQSAPGLNYGWYQPNGYDERPIYDSYGGWPSGPPPLQYDGRSCEENPLCFIM